MKKFTCEECLAYCICPQKPKREDYADENKYLIDLESGVWSCKDTVQKVCKENAKLKEQIEKMKKYAKLLQDICVVLGNEDFMIAAQLEGVVKELWSEEKEGFRMVESIKNRLLEIEPSEWAEINDWELAE